MDPSMPSPFDLRIDEVTAMTVDGAPLSSVEQMLYGVRLPEEDKDALWLVAWALGQRLKERDRVAAPERRRRALR
jgi:hypothetical protein